MRFLIDECIDTRIAEALAAAGHDVEEARINHTGTADIDLAAIAVASGRVVVTDDRDFGDLAFRDRIPMVGVVLVRMAGRPYQERVARILRATSPSSKIASPRASSLSNPATFASGLCCDRYSRAGNRRKKLCGHKEGGLRAALVVTR